MDVPRSPFACAMPHTTVSLKFTTVAGHLPLPQPAQKLAPSGAGDLQSHRLAGRFALVRAAAGAGLVVEDGERRLAQRAERGAIEHERERRAEQRPELEGARQPAEPEPLQDGAVQCRIELADELPRQGFPEHAAERAGRAAQADALCRVGKPGASPERIELEAAGFAFSREAVELEQREDQ